VTATAAPSAGASILVVDDEPHIGRIIRMRLEQEAFTVWLAESAPEALTLLEAQPRIALIVLDLMLPGMSGNTLLRIIRDDPRWSTLPCIVLTAAGQEAQLRDVESLGVSEVMTKPFSPRRLLERVVRYASHRSHTTAPDPSSGNVQ